MLLQGHIDLQKCMKLKITWSGTVKITKFKNKDSGHILAILPQIQKKCKIFLILCIIGNFGQLLAHIS